MTEKSNPDDEIDLFYQAVKGIKKIEQDKIEVAKIKSKPNKKVLATKELIIFPEIRASRPKTTLILEVSECLFLMNVPYAEANFTASKGVRLSPTFPPIVPRIPEIDLIKVIRFILFRIYLVGRQACFGIYF